MSDYFGNPRGRHPRRYRGQRLRRQKGASAVKGNLPHADRKRHQRWVKDDVFIRQQARADRKRLRAKERDQKRELRQGPFICSQEPDLYQGEHKVCQEQQQESQYYDFMDQFAPLCQSWHEQQFDNWLTQQLQPELWEFYCWVIEQLKKDHYDKVGSWPSSFRFGSHQYARWKTFGWHLENLGSSNYRKTCANLRMKLRCFHLPLDLPSVAFFASHLCSKQDEGAAMVASIQRHAAAGNCTCDCGSMGWSFCPDVLRDMQTDPPAQMQRNVPAMVSHSGDE